MNGEYKAAIGKKFRRLLLKDSNNPAYVAILEKYSANKFAVYSRGTLSQDIKTFLLSISSTTSVIRSSSLFISINLWYIFFFCVLYEVCLKSSWPNNDVKYVLFFNTFTPCFSKNSIPSLKCSSGNSAKYQSMVAIA